jgi:hypothetical protein
MGKFSHDFFIFEKQFLFVTYVTDKNLRMNYTMIKEVKERG